MESFRHQRGGNSNADIVSMEAAVGGWSRESLGRNGSELFEDYKEGGGGGGGGTREPLLRRRRTLNTTSQIAIVGANVCPIESLDYE